MRQKALFSLVVSMIVLVVPSVAFAYIGPGAGLAAIGTVLALIGGIFLAILAFLWYPIKRLRMRIRRKKQGRVTANEEHEEHVESAKTKVENGN